MDVILAAHVSISIQLDEVTGVGEARRRAVELAEALHLSDADISRVGLVATEAAANVVQHAGRGEILLRAYARVAPASVEIIAVDRGPGIANVHQAMQDGYSTCGAAGMGLGAIARLATVFEITSTPGKGTALLARIGRVTSRHPALGGLEWGAVCVSKRGEQVCGDAWMITATDGGNVVLVVDGLGHGPAAFDAAQHVLRSFKQLRPSPPASGLVDLHAGMRADHKTSRGAVAAIAEIDWRAREVRFAGAGNIDASVVPESGPLSSMVSHAGTLGQQVTRFQQFSYRWPDRGLVIFHSDGLSDRWQLDDYPGLSRKDPGLIAGVLYRDFASRRDDVVVVVGRERDAPGVPP